MLNKTTLIFFIALSSGLWLGLSFPLFSDGSKGTFIEELMEPGNIIGAFVGGAVGAIVHYFFSIKKKSQ